MTDTNLLREKIKLSGLRLKYIAAQIGVTPQGLYLKLNNTNQFRAAEIQKICELLKITDPDEMKCIFFAAEVSK